MRGSVIYSISRNIRGAIVITGILGIRQYYGYTIRVCRSKYMKEFRNTTFVNQN